MAQKNVVLTFDDACVNHLTQVVPLLKELGFGGTFFISTPAVWYEKFPGAFLDGEGILAIHRAGFEIGNHTVNHPDLRSKSEDECRREISELNNFLQNYGIPEPVSFAYPGGPYAGNAVPVLRECGVRFARTTERALWHKNTDLYRIPCFSVCEKEAAHFSEAMEALENSDDENSAAVLLYHGVPDEPHPWCSTPWELFEEQMRFLAARDIRVWIMRDFGTFIEA